MVQKEAISKHGESGWTMMVYVPILSIKGGRSNILRLYSTSKHVNGYWSRLRRISHGKSRKNLVNFFVLSYLFTQIMHLNFKINLLFRNYDRYVQEHVSNVQNRRGTIRAEKEMDYIPWLRQQLQNEENSVLKKLANGPKFEAISYSSYAINGYVFCTADSEISKTTQNSGVSMKAVTKFRSSVNDTNFVSEEVPYYGIVKQILELDYHDFKVVVFNCDWVRIENTNSIRVDPETNLRYVNLERLMRTTKESDEPFILASQASQVFYCKDQSRPTDEWHVVLDAPKRLNQDMDSYEDPLVFEARTNENAYIGALHEDIIDVDII